MKELVLEKQEADVPVRGVAKCHVAALNAGQGLLTRKNGDGKEEKPFSTANHFVHKYQNGGFTRGVLILEDLLCL